MIAAKFGSENPSLEAFCAVCGVRFGSHVGSTCPRDKPYADDQTARQFDTGANRSDDSQKPDYEGYLSPLVIERFGRYMLAHQYAGKRTSDNWQRGIPKDAYLKSLLRHLLEVWLIHRKHRDPAHLEDALCGVLFNTMGYLHEHLKQAKVR